MGFLNTIRYDTTGWLSLLAAWQFLVGGKDMALGRDCVGRGGIWFGIAISIFVLCIESVVLCMQGSVILVFVV